MPQAILERFFEAEHIRYYASLPLSECTLLYPRKLPAYAAGVCFFLIPYRVNDKAARNVSQYAVARDYHLYVKELEARLAPLLSGVEFALFTDNSPFAERTCAQKAGLGRFGKNRLLIHPECGSYFFIGSIVLPFPISIAQTGEKCKSDLCENCERCLRACPAARGDAPECLAGLTQKKRVTPEEEAVIRKYPLRWGCDVCQDVCPYNKNVPDTPIEFFHKDRLPYLTPEILCAMTDEEFAERAYAWRGRAVIERNVNL